MSYRTTGRKKDPEEFPIIKEELRYNEPELHPPKKESHSTNNQTQGDRLYYLYSGSLGNFLENGHVKYFPSKNSAKKIRNVLHKKHPTSWFEVKKFNLQDDRDYEDLGGLWGGYLGAWD